MEKWKAILLTLALLACFGIAAYIEVPYEYYKVIVMK